MDLKLEELVQNCSTSELFRSSQSRSAIDMMTFLTFLDLYIVLKYEACRCFVMLFVSANGIYFFVNSYTNFKVLKKHLAVTIIFFLK